MPAHLLHFLGKGLLGLWVLLTRRVGIVRWSLLEAGHPVSQLPWAAGRQGSPSQGAEDTELRRGGDSPGPTTGPRASSQASCSSQGSVDSTPGREVEVFLPLRAPQPQ